MGVYIKGMEMPKSCLNCFLSRSGCRAVLKRMRAMEAGTWIPANYRHDDCPLVPAADAIEELQKSVLRLEEASGILDELPMVDQRTPCDTCAHKGNVDFDYCHICNNEADMYKPKQPKEE